MPVQDAVDLVLKFVGERSLGPLGTGLDPSKAKNAASVLVQAALTKGSSDNITVLVVFL
jgi:serine/threonine protein phosphatase PrpC